MIRALLIGMIRIYRAVFSPWLGRVCRFEPSCSRYMLEALQVHGFPRGFFMGIKRLCRCHPFHPGGYDPVPESNNGSPPPHSMEPTVRTF